MASSAIIIERYYAALNQRNLDALDGLVSRDLVHHGLPGATTREALKRVLTDYHRAFPDLRHTTEDMVTGGDRLAVRTVTSGTHLGTFLGHAPTGRKYSAAAMSFYRVQDGLIQEIWEVFDTIAMLQQLGLYTPANASRSEGAGQGRRPPGPSAEVPLAQIRSNPLSFLQSVTREYGDCVRYVCEGRETILLNQPQAVRHVLHDRESNYSKLNTPDLLLLAPMLGDGLLTTVGPIWKRDRQWLQTVLSHRQLERSAALMVEVVEEMLLRWQGRPDPSAPLNMVREMSRLTLEIAARVLFSSDFASRSEAFGEAMDVLNESMSHARPDSPDVQRHFQPALESIRRTVWQTVLSRKFHDTGEDDLLAALLRAQREHGDTDGHVVDQAVTILLAGHETTAKAMSWAVALLDANPDALLRLQSELDACLAGRSPALEDLPNLRFTRAVIDEGLRLDPPIWLLTRTALEDDEIGGFSIPAGALVAISPYLLHRHPQLWKDPERFLPERFLTANDSPLQAYRYLPFGQGPRHCVGRFFAMLEMPLALAAIYSKFALRLPAGDVPQEEALVTLRPRGGLLTIASGREFCGAS